MTIELAAEKREIFGKKLAKARKEGKLPGVFYSGKEETTPIFLSDRDFKKALKEAGETTVISLKIGSDTKDVLIHDVSYDPVKSEPTHVDFYVVEKGKKITVSVPLEFTGVAPAVKELSGTLVKVMHEIEVETIPSNIPHEIEVDISGLKDFESQIAIKDLKLPNGVEATDDPEETVALVSEPKGEEEEEETTADFSQIEVEKKGKREEEGEEEKEG